MQSFPRRPASPAATQVRRTEQAGAGAARPGRGAGASGARRRGGLGRLLGFAPARRRGRAAFGIRGGRSGAERRALEALAPPPGGAGCAASSSAVPSRRWRGRALGGAPAQAVAAHPLLHRGGQARGVEGTGVPGWVGQSQLWPHTGALEGEVSVVRAPAGQAPRCHPRQPRESRLERGFIFKTTSRGAQAASNFPPCARGGLAALCLRGWSRAPGSQSPVNFGAGWVAAVTLPQDLRARRRAGRAHALPLGAQEAQRRGGREPRLFRALEEEEEKVVGLPHGSWSWLPPLNLGRRVGP